MYFRKNKNQDKHSPLQNQEPDIISETYLDEEQHVGINYSMHDSDLSRDSLVDRTAFNNLPTYTDDQDELMSSELESQLMDKESKEWYKRVMRWTTDNKRAYLWVKVIQTLFSLLMLAVTGYFYTRWQKTRPDDPIMPAARLMLIMHTFDLVIYLCDFIMVLKRWRFFITLRFILACIAFTLGLMI